MPVTIRLGGPRGTRRESEGLRGGAVVVESPFGLAPVQRLLAEALPKEPRGAAPGAPVRALFGMDTEGSTALVAAHLWPGAAVEWFHLDAYVAAKVAGVFADNGRADLVAGAAAEMPPGPFDVVALPFPSAGEALLMRDLLEAAHDALRPRGRLVAATDRSGSALRSAIEEVFGRVTQGPPSRRGATFFAERKRERPQRKDRSHVLAPEIAPAGGGAPVAFRLETRPGTFSHGSLDRGTRTLLEWFDPEADRTVLDLGAGCGAIGIFAALRAPGLRVTMVESNVRAAECARRNVERNGLADRAEVIVRADLEDVPVPGNPADPSNPGFDRVLANPPYFGELRIAKSFAAAASRALRRGGRVAYVVRAGKAADANAEVLRDVFGRCVVVPAGDYSILPATKRWSAGPPAGLFQAPR
jgi:16S rRNA (guanine1207-N2)-methyltransferase